MSLTTKTPPTNLPVTKMTTVPLMQRPVQLLIVLVVCLLFVSQIRFSQLANPAQDNVPANRVATGVLVDVNRAELRELSLLPSVGPVLARRIVSDRQLNGPFKSLGDLKRIHGIGDKKLAQIRLYCVSPAPAAAESLMALASESP
ncbi:ComEA family DNA-binding protein [Planctomycetes bacterium K23_9]|uniref:ComE operon protein 1 n=1 Tax=Stieleria marina TaxID=1930275 RepID=A0A517P0Z2_9BACT|nr:ComE operon protein 1 [Planctomycetes bacterium K23_9]